jgi:hypothetical protein
MELGKEKTGGSGKYFLSVATQRSHFFRAGPRAAEVAGEGQVAGKSETKMNALRNKKRTGAYSPILFLLTEQTCQRPYLD